MLIHSTVEKRAKRMPDTTVETTRHIRKKTTLIILNQKERKDEIISIKIGNDYVSQEKSAKLLGVTFDANQGWKTQIYGPGGVIMSEE